MSPEEVRLRSLYLFQACSHAVNEFKNRLLTTFPAQPLTSTLMLDRSLTRELGMLFRYWTTRQIWDQLEDAEADAKNLNLALLRLFTDGFKLPKDGSGLKYAELSSPSEEVQELGQRMTAALGMEHQPLLDALHAGIVGWRDEVTRQTKEALELPIIQLSSLVKAQAEEATGET